ncbi:MAG: PEP-CTERM sorting domain-containing protein [Sphaerospermopsis sp. SIO1G1]|nr:PEP-CTERM sorting domain-containing protein [Sphaerospermopsis sp. SIO1G1]
MSPIHHLFRLAGTALALSISLTPGIANALSLTFNPPGGNSLTINDRFGPIPNTNDLSFLKNYIQFDQTFGDIEVSGTLYGQYIQFTRNQSNSNVSLSVNGTDAIVLTLTDFELKNNGNTSINVSNFLNISASPSDFSTVLVGNDVDFYLNYKGSYSQSVGSSSVSSSYSVGYGNDPTLNLSGTPAGGSNFSSFTFAGNQGEVNISDLYMDILDFNLASGASIVLPNSLTSLMTIDDEGSPLSEENVQQLSYLVKQQFAAQTVPEPSSLMGLLALGGLFTLGYKKGNHKPKN